MAPPTPILSRDEITRAYKLKKLLNTNNCQFKSLTQYECTSDNGLYTCNPFKRVFWDCLLDNGRRQVVEVTTMETNEVHAGIDKRKFLSIQADLKRAYDEAEKNISVT